MESRRSAPRNRDGCESSMAVWAARRCSLQRCIDTRSPVIRNGPKVSFGGKDLRSLIGPRRGPFQYRYRNRVNNPRHFRINTPTVVWSFTMKHIRDLTSYAQSREKLICDCRLRRLRLLINEACQTPLARRATALHECY